MTHPLSDAICEELADTEDRPFTNIEMDNMRAAADWQLEQVIKTLNQCKKKRRACIEVMYLFQQKLEEMRPTQEDN